MYKSKIMWYNNKRINIPNLNAKESKTNDKTVSKRK